MKNKYDYKKKSNKCLVIGGILKVLLPGTLIGDAVLGLAVANAAADIYWHPEDYSDLIEKIRPMPEEYMTEEDKEAYNRHNDKIDKLNSDGKEIQNDKKENKEEK